jgi:hypothetical protein
MTGRGCLADRQQDHCVLDGLQRVPGVRHDQEITRTAFQASFLAVSRTRPR